MIRPTILAVAAALAATGSAKAAESEYFIVHALDRDAGEAAAVLREHVEADEDWLFLAEFGLAGGAVTALKICYLGITEDLVAAPSHIMAMMPCGHLAFYEDDGQPTLSMLDLDFMTALEDDPHLHSAAEAGKPAFAALLSDTLGLE